MQIKNRSTVAGIFFGYFIMGLVDIVGISANYVKADFSLSDSVSSFLPLIAFISFAFLAVPSGMLMNRIGRKNTHSSLDPDYRLYIPCHVDDFCFGRDRKYGHANFHQPSFSGCRSGKQAYKQSHFRTIFPVCFFGNRSYSGNYNYASDRKLEKHVSYLCRNHRNRDSMAI